MSNKIFETIMEVYKNESANGVELTEAENELYDRQIRLWGLESQKRFLFREVENKLII